MHWFDTTYKFKFIVSLISLLSLMPFAIQAQDHSATDTLNKNNTYTVKSINWNKYLIVGNKRFSDEELISEAALKSKWVIPVPSLEEFKPIFINAYLNSEKYNSWMYARISKKV